VRLALALAVVTLACPAVASAQTVSIGASPAPAKYDRVVTFSGALAPAQGGLQVELYLTVPSAHVVGTATTAADGSWSIATHLRAPGPYVARVHLDPSTVVDSSPIGVTVRPRLSARIAGKRTVGSRLVLGGRVLPAKAGTLTFRLGKKVRRVRVGSAGRFRLSLANALPGRWHWRLALKPRAGYAKKVRANTLVVRGGSLSWGARGNAVRVLEHRLRQLHHVLKAVDGYYGEDTYQAVLAFQKVHGLARTGRITPGLWNAIARASVPRAFVPRGTHIEVSKTKQVMYEVVKGKVARIMHVSTGATGNTPVGTWRVYRLGPGGSLSGMYYSIYFLRGFAIHGYHSVPPYQASHGCVRTPLWFARAFYERWGHLGTVIRIFP
jgi:hypothetical protein